MKRPFRNYSQKPKVKKGVPSNSIKTHNFNEMKRHKHLFLIFFGIILISLKVSAENPEGRFRIEEGDWFESKIELPFNFDFRSADIINKIVTDPGDTDLSLILRYQLQKQLNNGNQVFNVSIKRIQAKMLESNFNAWMGYDSYYPTYQDDIDQIKPFIQVEMEVTPDGSISRFDSISGALPVLNFDEISKLNDPKIGVVFSMVLPIEFLQFASTQVALLPPESGTKNLNMIGAKEDIIVKTKQFSESPYYYSYQITLDDSISTEIRLSKNERVNLATIVDASFPIPANTLIKGILNGEGNKDITIRLDVDYDGNNFTNKHFKTESDGTFNCPIFINRPFYLNIRIGNKWVKSFIEPNDTLEISAIPQNLERYSREATFYDLPTQQGYMINSTDFAGKAANNARLSVEMNEWVARMVYPESVDLFLNFQSEIHQNVEDLIDQYRGKATEACINYFSSRCNYFLAVNKFYFADDTERYYTRKALTDKGQKEEVTMDYPADFLLEVDTLSTVMHPFEWGFYYREFLDYSYDYKKERLGMSVGGLDKDFYSNYYFARASLKGLPLYTKLYETLDKELRKGFNTAGKIESFYQDFIHNCNDPELVDPLTKTHQTISKLAIGNTFPIQSYTLKDSTVFHLNEYKGKPVCLAFLHAPKRDINDFKKEIEKFDADEVEFVFIYLPNNYMNQDPIDSSILALPNVKLIEVQDEGLKDKILLASMAKIFVLDKWLRIVDDDIPNPSNYFGAPDLENAIKKAIQAKRYSKQQKASVIKTAGWSIGSILLTLLIVLWIYRIRVRNLKKREAIKRQIKELEIKAIRSQMNPHFVFNALNSIQSLVNSNQYKETNIYLAKFSVLLRGVLNNSEKSRVTLSDELEAVKLYCELEQLRFEFELTFEVDQDLDSDLIEIPGMIIQPLAENAVVHGLAPLGNKGLLQIKINKCSEGLCVTVSDNGVGLPDRSEDKLREKGYGLKLVEERIAILSQKDKKARLRLESNREGKGTIATLIIPIDNV